MVFRNSSNIWMVQEFFLKGVASQEFLAQITLDLASNPHLESSFQESSTIHIKYLGVSALHNARYWERLLSLTPDKLAPKPETSQMPQTEDIPPIFKLISIHAVSLA